MVDYAWFRKHLKDDKKGHICPPSDATHPKDRWETAFVYAYICRFTQLKTKCEGFNSPMDLEEALLTPPPLVDKLLQDILTRFVLILRPQSRNISPGQLLATVSNVLSEFFKTNERSVFWNETTQSNVDPLADIEGGFWGADWDLKLKILRQLVEYQLCHAPQIREMLDRAWGVKQHQHKKKEDNAAPPEDEDPHSHRSLLMEPLGQDISKKRYWVVDSSARLYISSNPWKVASSFSTVSSNKDEYIKVIEDLKVDGPTSGSQKKPTKFETMHNNLVSCLEKRIDEIDADLARVERARKKIEQRNLLLAQAEVRGPRTRRQAQRPDYVYNDGISDDDGQDDYMQEDEAEVDEGFDYLEDEENGWDDDGPRRSSRQRNGRHLELRRSTRQRTEKPSAPTEEESMEWRGERRSRRLGATDEMELDTRSRKRSRTADSSEAGSIALNGASGSGQNGSASGSAPSFHASGAAALKATEVPVEAVQGKKKNKFWFYAVEPVLQAVVSSNEDMADALQEDVNPTKMKNRYRRIIDSTEPSEATNSVAQSPAPDLESSAPMSLDSEAEEG